MTREEKCELAVKIGFTYDSKTGLVKNNKGKIVFTTNNNGYLKIQMVIHGKNIQLYQHHFAYYITHQRLNKEHEHIDHIDGNKSNNRIANLRILTHQENMINTSKHKGYSKYLNKYKATITIDGKKLTIGVYDTESEARSAYLKAKSKYHIIGNSMIKDYNIAQTVFDQPKVKQKFYKRNDMFVTAFKINDISISISFNTQEEAEEKYDYLMQQYQNNGFVFTKDDYKKLINTFDNCLNVKDKVKNKIIKELFHLQLKKYSQIKQIINSIL
jgi:hypothetical protein